MAYGQQHFLVSFFTPATPSHKKVPEPDERWRAADLYQVKRLYGHSHFEIPKSKWQFGDISVNHGFLAKSFAKKK